MATPTRVQLSLSALQSLLNSNSTQLKQSVLQQSQSIIRTSALTNHHKPFRKLIVDLFGNEYVKLLTTRSTSTSWLPQPPVVNTTKRSLLLHSICTHRQQQSINQNDELRVLRVGENSPACLFDSLSLNLSRSIADVLITTGEILRCEPQYSSNIQSPFDRLFANYSKDVTENAYAIRWPTVPAVCILTNKFEDLRHKVFHESIGHVIMYTTLEHARCLSNMHEKRPQKPEQLDHCHINYPITIPLSHGFQKPIHIVGTEQPSLLKCIQFLEDYSFLYSPRCPSSPIFSLECGPTTINPLYGCDSPRTVNILQLSTHSSKFTKDQLQKWCLLRPSFTEKLIREQYRTHHEALWRDDENDAEWTFRYCTRSQLP